MHAIFSRRVFVVGSSSLLKKKPTLSHRRTQSRHFLLPSGISSFPATSCFVPSLLSRTEKIHGFFASTLRNTHLTLKFGNLLESRVGFFSFGLPSKGFTGFQKRGWRSWFNGANGVVYGLILANAAVFTMWRVSERQWMIKNFVLSSYTVMSGRIHTLITSGFSYSGITHFVINMLGLFYFGTRIARTLGPLYVLKLYFAGSLCNSVFFLSDQALMPTALKGFGVVTTDPLKPKPPGFGVVTTVPSKPKPAIVRHGADGSVYAIMLLEIFLYPKVTTYFELMLRVPAKAGVLNSGNNILKMLEGQNNSISASSGLLGGLFVATMAWARLRKGGF